MHIGAPLVSSKGNFVPGVRSRLGLVRKRVTEFAHFNLVGRAPEYVCDIEIANPGLSALLPEELDYPLRLALSELALGAVQRHLPSLLAGDDVTPLRLPA